MVKLYLFFDDEAPRLCLTTQQSGDNLPRGAFTGTTFAAGEVNVELSDPPLYGASSAEVLKQAERMGYYIFPWLGRGNFNQLPESVRRMARRK